MLVGESGSGKSTTAWALLHHGCCYFSDELGPVDLQTGEVYPYPHALWQFDDQFAVPVEVGLMPNQVFEPIAGDVV
jgi:hypothetical protein